MHKYSSTRSRSAPRGTVSRYGDISAIAIGFPRTPRLRVHRSEIARHCHRHCSPRDHARPQDRSYRRRPEPKQAIVLITLSARYQSQNTIVPLVTTDERLFVTRSLGRTEVSDTDRLGDRPYDFPPGRRRHRSGRRSRRRPGRTSHPLPNCGGVASEGTDEVRMRQSVDSRLAYLPTIPPVLAPSAFPSRHSPDGRDRLPPRSGLQGVGNAAAIGRSAHRVVGRNRFAEVLAEDAWAG